MTTRLEQATDCTDPQDLDAILRDEHEEDSPGERAAAGMQTSGSRRGAVPGKRS
jgi:hypothetical protein